MSAVKKQPGDTRGPEEEEEEEKEEEEEAWAASGIGGASVGEQFNNSLHLLLA